MLPKVKRNRHCCNLCHYMRKRITKIHPDCQLSERTPDSIVDEVKNSLRMHKRTLTHTDEIGIIKYGLFSDNL